ncbi:hypothetical protein Hypma_009896 [Hypsizygus marmoreus]|uniref:BTB domain-containing protein n=1 Tax=Hypsizygus marmoreus TaxID=39966 RepID=A0A369JUR9_HYPMA|nr:hypothetical protein Hypma_009896 [Hypsizygus marmoreus]
MPLVASSGPISKQFSKEFCFANADITFKSSDDVLFGVHKAQLEATTGGFVSTELHSKDEVVPLPESSAVLEWLFRFIYPKLRQKLDADLQFEMLDELSEAAEKYEVYNAMDACETRMSETLPNHADRIIHYAIKHNYSAMVDAAAEALLRQPVGQAMKKLPQNLFLAWALYHDQWSNLQRMAIYEHPYGFGGWFSFGVPGK